VVVNSPVVGVPVISNPIRTGAVESVPVTKDQSASDRALVAVTLPPDAKLYVDGVLVDTGSKTRTFKSPALEKGQDYYYTLKAEVMRDGKPATREQRAIVRANEIARIDFTDLAAKQVSELKAAPAKVTVQIPEDARLFVNDVLCPMTSTKRTFDTPELPVGQKFAYTLRAEANRNGQTLRAVRKVEMQAGQEVNVKFDDFEVVQTAQR